MSILFTKCSNCIHSEVCNLQEQVKFIQDSMRVTIEDCDHYLSSVNWVGCQDDEDEEEEDYSCNNQCRCENCGHCSIPGYEDEEDTQEEESDKVWDSILADLDSILSKLGKKSEPKTRKWVVDVPERLDIRIGVASAMSKLLHEGHEPVSLTVTTEQLKRLVGKVPEDLEDAGINVCGVPVKLWVNENITSSYIRYIPKEEV